MRGMGFTSRTVGFSLAVVVHFILLFPSTPALAQCNGIVPNPQYPGINGSEAQDQVHSGTQLGFTTRNVGHPSTGQFPQWEWHNEVLRASDNSLFMQWYTQGGYTLRSGFPNDGTRFVFRTRAKVGGPVCDWSEWRELRFWNGVPETPPGAPRLDNPINGRIRHGSEIAFQLKNTTQEMQFPGFNWEVRVYLGYEDSTQLHATVPRLAPQDFEGVYQGFFVLGEFPNTGQVYSWEARARLDDSLDYGPWSPRAIFFSGTPQGIVVLPSPDVPQEIPDTGEIKSRITYQGKSSGKSVDYVKVEIDVTHTYLGDLRCYLESPSGTVVRLIDRVGGSGDNFFQTQLSDSAPLHISSGRPPFVGSFRPDQPLSAFRGEPMEGVWTLTIQDLAAFDVGTLDGWSLMIGEADDEGEGASEGEVLGEGEPQSDRHNADSNGDGVISLSELLRVIQLYNSNAYHCAVAPGATEDGYIPGATGGQDCVPHASDYNPQDWRIVLSELLRIIQFFNAGAFHPCPTGEDGFCPGQS